MDEAAKDYKEETMVPDPTWAERLVTWFKLMNGLRKTIMALLAIGVVGVGGNIAEINPWKEAAIEVGLVEPDKIPEIKGDVAEHTHALQEHTHPESPHTHPDEAHDHPMAEHSHEQGAAATLMPAATLAAIQAEIQKLLPPNHRSLH